MTSSRLPLPPITAALLVALSGCTGSLGTRLHHDAGPLADGGVRGDAAFAGDAGSRADADLGEPTDAAIAIHDGGVDEPDAAITAPPDAAADVDTGTPAMESCPVGPAALRSYPATWADGECIVQWSHDGSIVRARYWAADSGERVLYAEITDPSGTPRFCGADLLHNLLGTVEGGWAALAFPLTPPSEGGRAQPLPDCARFADLQHLLTWSHDGSDVRARRTPAGVLYAESDSGGSYHFVPGHWVGAAGGTGTPHDDLCFAEEMP